MNMLSSVMVATRGGKGSSRGRELLAFASRAVSTGVNRQSGPCEPATILLSFSLLVPSYDAHHI